MFSAVLRARVLSDVFALAAANNVPYKTAFNVTKYLSEENAYAPLAVAIDALMDIYNRLDDSEEAVKAKTFILSKIQKQFDAILDFNTISSQNKEDYLNMFVF